MDNPKYGNILLVTRDDRLPVDLQGRLAGSYRIHNLNSRAQVLSELSLTRHCMLIFHEERTCVDGLEFVRGLRRMGNMLPLIFLSGHECNTDKKEASQLGVKSCINLTDCSENDILEHIRLVCMSCVSLCPMSLNSRDIHDKIHKAISYISKNFGTNLGLKGIGKELGVAPAYLGRLFKSQTGLTFTQYLNSFRVHMAKKMLMETSKNLTDIMLSWGYNTEQHFFKQFKKYTGSSPRAFQKNKEGRSS